MPTVFICHSSHDRDVIEQEIVDLLDRHGVTTWYSKHDIRTAEEWERSILRGLNECDWFLVAVSRNALESQWVRSEVHWAVEFRWGRIIPVMLEPSNLLDLHLRLSQVQYVDFAQDREAARRKLLAVWGIPYFSTAGEETRAAGDYQQMRRRVAELPGYSLKRTIGRGSLGTVFLAYSERFNGLVAIKVLDVRIGSETVAGVVRSAQRLLLVRHPALVSIHDVNLAREFPYVVMEFVDGSTLAQVLRRGVVSATQGADLTAALAEGIHYAHQNGIVHHDLKPENIFINHDGRPKIGDFGIDPSDLPSGWLLGTPAYMAPETILGEPLGVSSDVWSLGCVFYEMLTGTRPFDWAGSMPEQMRLITTTAPRLPRQFRPDTPAELERICLNCLARDPSKRYGSAGELAAELRRCQGDAGAN